jgi:surfactin synthase thioesterase subunit
VRRVISEEDDVLPTKDRTTASAWITRPEPQDQPAAARLFCLPYAGGGASLYRAWPAAMLNLDVVALQLPGREERIDEPAVPSIQPIVEMVTDVIAPLLDRPYAIFGHSMGARIAFELTRELRRRGEPAPAMLFVSACKAPHIPRVPTPPISAMPDRLFINLLRGMSGTPPEVIDDPEFLRTVLPTLRADFAVVDGYDYSDEPALDVPIRAFGGTADGEVREDDLMAWQAHTRADFGLRMLRGGHFIVRTAQRDITRAIAEDLSAAIGAGP